MSHLQSSGLIWYTFIVDVRMFCGCACGQLPDLDNTPFFSRECVDLAVRLIEKFDDIEQYE